MDSQRVPAAEQHPEETGAVPATKATKESGVPAKSLFTVGAVGSIIVAIGSMAYMMTSGVFFSYHWWGGWDGNVLFVIPLALFSVGMILHSFGFLGFHAASRSGLGMATFIYTIVAIAIYIVLMSLTIIDVGFFYSHYTSGYLAGTLVGIGLILMGTDLMIDGKKLVRESLFLPAGIMYIVAGSFLLTFFLAYFVPIAWIILFIGAIFSAVAFGALRYGYGAAEAEVSRPIEEMLDFEFCPDCGGRIDGFRFCPHCGTRMQRHSGSI